MAGKGFIFGLISLICLIISSIVFTMDEDQFENESANFGKYYPINPSEGVKIKLRRETPEGLSPPQWYFQDLKGSRFYNLPTGSGSNERNAPDYYYPLISKKSLLGIELADFVSGNKENQQVGGSGSGSGSMKAKLFKSG